MYKVYKKAEAVARLLIALLLVVPMVCAALGAAHAEEAAQTAYALDLTDLFQAALAVLATLITGYLIPWLKAKAGKEKQELTETMIDVAVYAAQQLYETNTISNRLDYACSWLKARGVTVDRAQVEACVKRYKTGSIAALVDETLKDGETA